MKEYTVYRQVTLSQTVSADSEEEAVDKAENTDKYDWSELNEDVWVEEG